MTDNRFRISTGIPREARKAYIKQADQWCEYSERFGNGERDDTCRDYRHYVRCTEHEYCHCEGDTLILVCERCWGKVLNEIRKRQHAQMEMPTLEDHKRPDRDALGAVVIIEEVRHDHAGRFQASRATEP